MIDPAKIVGKRAIIERGRGLGSRGNQAYEALLARLRSGDLTPGTRLREEELAETLGVSRTPVREALARLQARGLVDASSGGLAIAQLTRPQIMELYAMRAVLEGAAARFAAQNAAPSEIAGIEHITQKFEQFDGEAKKVAELNTLFHQTIYEAAHNAYLISMLEDLNDSLSLLPNTTFAVPGRTSAAKVEHAAILNAIQLSQPDEADQLARAHIDAALKGRLHLIFGNV